MASVATRRGRDRPTRARQLGAVELSIPAGRSESLVVPLSDAAAQALDTVGTLQVTASAVIAAGGRHATARYSGRIAMPTGAFQPGHYAGTTSQGLPISLFVSRAEVGSALFDWRAVCADGKTHRRAILLHGRPIVSESPGPPNRLRARAPLCDPPWPGRVPGPAPSA